MTVKAGAPVSFVARAAMRSGDHLSIAALRTGETKLRNVANCSRSPCGGAWRETIQLRVRFQAVLVRGSGKSAKLLGQSRILSVTWKLPPAPPPPPAQAGHYEGKDSQNENFAFDVTADGKNVVNLATGQINTSCTPNIGTTSGGYLNLPGPYPIAADGSFTISISDIIVVSGISAPRSIAITGHFTGAVATGTLVVQYNIGGAICSTGNQTWTIPRIS